MNYTIYNKISGRIISLVSLPENFIQHRINDDEDYLDNHMNASEYYISVETKQPVKIPEKPSEYHEFNFDSKQWIDQRTSESEWNVVRFKRNTLMVQCDWTQMPDVNISTKETWAAYRQALRDITNQTDPFNITWPTPPQ
jgi:hypothetical protein